MVLLVDERIKGEAWTDEDVGVLVEELRERRGKLESEGAANESASQLASAILENSREILSTIHRISPDEVKLLIAEFHEASAAIRKIVSNDQREATLLDTRAKLLEGCITHS